MDYQILYWFGGDRIPWFLSFKETLSDLIQWKEVIQSYFKERFVPLVYQRIISNLLF